MCATALKVVFPFSLLFHLITMNYLGEEHRQLLCIVRPLVCLAQDRDIQQFARVSGQFLISDTFLAVLLEKPGIEPGSFVCEANVVIEPF